MFEAWKISGVGAVVVTWNCGKMQMDNMDKVNVEIWPSNLG